MENVDSIVCLVGKERTGGNFSKSIAEAWAMRNQCG